MPACLHPLRAWRLPAGHVVLREPVDRPEGTSGLSLPCGGCLACRCNKARDWSIRCQLELRDHRDTVWSTLTYDDSSLPITLRPDHLSAFVKRLRARLELSDRRFRFFASGEYGERTQRPHYHMIHFGMSEDDEREIQAAWPHGMIRVDPISPRAISYVAGYVSKKIGYKLDRAERVDPETGECYTWEPPFIRMSRRPGIGSSAREHWQSWRTAAVVGGRKVPVPRFLHEAYRDNASFVQLVDLETEKFNALTAPLPETADINYFADKRSAESLMLQRKQADQARRRSYE